MQVFTVDLYQEFGILRGEAKGGVLTCCLRSEGSGVRFRPAMLVLPGGGYSSCSDREAEPIAVAFQGKGFHTFVLEYSCAGCKEKANFPVPFDEACLAMWYIRKNADKFGVIRDKVASVGFSAGGHLLGLIATCTPDQTALAEKVGTSWEDFRPDAAVFSYPVVSGTQVTHFGSLLNLMGDDPEKQRYFSIENHVDKRSAPAFIWHTADDGCVPVENSFLLATAYQKAGVDYELHIFQNGPHGLALCNEETVCGWDAFDNPHVGSWVTLVGEWLKIRGFTVKG